MNAAAACSPAPATAPIRVLLVDDDPLIRTGLRLMLSPAADVEVVGEAADGDEVTEAVNAHHPDVVLLDVRMHRVNGIDAVRSLKTRPTAPKVLMLTTFEHDEVAFRSVEAGADGFLLKTSSPDQITDGIRQVHRGAGVVSPATAKQLMTRMRDDRFAADRSTAARLVARLTDRERDVLTQVGHGRTNPQIAAALFLGEATVKSYLASAIDKLGCTGRTGAAIIAYQAGLLPAEPR
jgi:DNA-binding NarL/FixJ family response regulator